MESQNQAKRLSATNHNINHVNHSLFNKPTHKLSRSNSLTISSHQSSQYNQNHSSPSKSSSKSRPNSPIKSISSSPLIIHRSQTINNLNYKLKSNHQSLSSEKIDIFTTPKRNPCLNLNPTSNSNASNSIFNSDFNNNKTQHNQLLEFDQNQNQDQQQQQLEPIQENSINHQPLSNSNSLSVTSPVQSDHHQTENVLVCVRIKPILTSALSDIDFDTPISHHRQLSLNQKQANQTNQKFGSWLIDHSKSSISLSTSHPIIDRRGTGTSEALNGSDGYEFKLDRIFDPFSTTSDLYHHNVQSLIESCVKDGYNATIFAYGQTGSGKTFTMMGNRDDGDEESQGVIPRAIEQVFDVISSDSEREYLLRVSYLEIYNESLKDLLSDDPSSISQNRLTIYANDQGRIYVNGIREEVVSDPIQVLDAISRGEKSRHVGTTDWNERSSRSHTVFTMTVESRPKHTSSPSNDGLTQISQLNLIDLAGSESAASSSERRKEGAFINKSLLALSNVISKLAKHEPHIPYRDSKLTRLLQTSLSGNAKVLVICTISAGTDSVVETLSTLRFARRAKMVITKAERGTILDDQSALLQAYQQEITSLKAQLQQNSHALSISTTSTPALAELNAEKCKAESELTALRFERIRLQEQIEHLNRRILTSQTIESNTRRASNAHALTRRIVSGHEDRPSKPVKSRVSDFGGVMGMITLGLGASRCLHSGSGMTEDSHAQFQRELKLQQELKSVRLELEKLKQEKEDPTSHNNPSLNGIELLKQQISVLEGEKENLPDGLVENHPEAERIKHLEDQLEGMQRTQQELTDFHQSELKNLKDTISFLESAKQVELSDVHQTLEKQYQEQQQELKQALEADQEKIKELETLISELRHEHSTQKQRIQDATTAEQRIKDLELEYNNYKEEHEALLEASQAKLTALELNSTSSSKQEDKGVSAPSDSSLSTEFELKLKASEELRAKLEVELNSLCEKTKDEFLAHKEAIALLESERANAEAKVEELKRLIESESISNLPEKDLVPREELVKLEVECTNLQENLARLTTQNSPELDLFEAQQKRITELETELEQTRLGVGDLKTIENNTDDQTSNARIVKLEFDLSEAISTTQQLLMEKAALEEKVKQLGNDTGKEQVQGLERKLNEMKDLLVKEENARVAVEAELLEKSLELKIKTSSLSDLETDTSVLKAKLEGLEKKSFMEHNKTSEKEIELMLVIEERDKYLSETKQLQNFLNEQTIAQAEKLKSTIEFYNSKAQKAEEMAHEGQSDYSKLKKAYGDSESNLERAQSESNKLKAELKTVVMERTKQESQYQTLQHLVSSLEQELARKKEQEEEALKQSEKSFRQSLENEVETLKEAYNLKLEQLEHDKANLTAHLAKIGKDSMHQTTVAKIEKIVDLECTIEEQNRIIEGLNIELESLKKSTTHFRHQFARDRFQDHEHYHQSTEQELERLYHIVDEQEKRLSDAKTDLSKWQARVKSQAQIISKLQTPSQSDFQQRRLSLLSVASTDQCSTSSRSASKMSAPPLSTCTTVLGPTRTPAAWQPGHHSRPSSSLVGRSGPHVLESPKPLPVPASFVTNEEDEARRRKDRRRTIEKDMAKLKDENVVERKLNVLLSSATKYNENPNNKFYGEPSSKSVLSGISNRTNNRLSYQPSSSSTTSSNFLNGLATNQNNRNSMIESCGLNNNQRFNQKR